MTAIRIFWLQFMRFWHVIDLYTALQVGNWPMVTDCRLRIADIDAELDRLNCHKGTTL